MSVKPGGVLTFYCIGIESLPGFEKRSFVGFFAAVEFDFDGDGFGGFDRFHGWAGEGLMGGFFDKLAGDRGVEEAGDVAAHAVFRDGGFDAGEEFLGLGAPLVVADDEADGDIF